MSEHDELSAASNDRTIFERVKTLNFPIGQYIVVGGALEAHGIRKSDDVDIIATHELVDELVEQGWTPHSLNPGDVGEDGTKRKVSRDDVDVMTEFSWKDVTIAKTADLIAGAEIIQDIPFVPLHLLLQWKEVSEREKDSRDVELLRNYLENRES
jgi:hypothetical protein